MGIKLKKTCRFEKQLSAFIDGELTANQAAVLKKHLETCDACAREHKALQSVDNMLLGLQSIEPSAGFERGFWKRVDEVSKRKPWWSLPRPIYWGWRPSAVAAAAVVFIVCGIVFFNRPAAPPSAPAELVVAEDLDFYKDYEIINRLELFENWDAIRSMPEQS